MWLFVWNNRSVILYPSNPRNLYIPRQMCFSYLKLRCFGHAISPLSNHLHELLVDLILFDNRFQLCLAWVASPCQFTISFTKYRQKVICYKTNRKRVTWVREHTFMMTSKWWWWEVLEICHVFADSVVFEQLFYCLFVKTVGWE